MAQNLRPRLGVAPWRASILDDGEQAGSALSRAATAEERAELWPKVVKAYKGYAGYQRNTDREMALLICERLPAR